MPKGKLEKEVYNILERFPITRNSDVDLFATVYRYHYENGIVYFNGEAHIPVKFLKLKDTPKPDSITRERRKIQERGDFPPTDLNIKLMRERNRKRVSDAMIQDD